MSVDVWVDEKVGKKALVLGFPMVEWKEVERAASWDVVKVDA